MEDKPQQTPEISNINWLEEKLVRIRELEKKPDISVINWSGEQLARIGELDAGRDSDWILEKEGRPMALLTDPRWDDMFWYSYEVIPLTQDTQEIAQLFSDNFWWNPDGHELVWRNCEFGVVAENAFSSGFSSSEPGRVGMRALYIPVQEPPAEDISPEPPYPWEKWALWKLVGKLNAFCGLLLGNWEYNFSFSGPIEIYPPKHKDKPSPLLNVVCLCFPSVLVALVFGFEPPAGDFLLFGYLIETLYWLFWVYLSTLPVALLTLSFTRRRKATTAARRALLGFFVPMAVHSALPK